MKFSDKKSLVKAISVVDYLSSLGFTPVRSSGSYHYYYSPLPGRNEKKPSFLVRTKDGKWSDRGQSRRWEDVIQLVIEMNNCSFPEAVDILLKFKDIPTIIKPQKIEKDDTPSILIEEVYELHSFPLIYELKSRCINIDIASIYCQEAWIRFPKGNKPNKVHMVIAFKNDLGGYEFRNQYLKVSQLPKFYTTIPGTTPNRDLFEGFMDFLSFLTFYRIEHNHNNTYVLNSLIYINSLYDHMKQPGINRVYFDWDNAAEKHLTELKENDITYHDMRDLYFMYEDFNDMLKNHARLK